MEIKSTQLLKKLIELIGRVDYETLANPYNSDSFKLNQKHQLVLTIDKIIEEANLSNLDLCMNNEDVYLYNKQWWTKIQKDDFYKFLGEAAEKMGVPRITSKYYQFRENLYKQFLSSAYLPAPTTENDKVLINLQNGTFEINPKGTNSLRKFNSKDFLTYQLPFEYNPKATAPIFQSYLDKVVPELDKQQVLAEYLGYIFIRNGSNTLKAEKALILYGGGANGKSVFFDVVSALFGDVNTSNHSLQDLTNENGYYRAMIADKLVNYASEINGKLEASIFKQLVSGEPITARLPYGNPIQLKQYAKLIFNTNKLPTDVEHTNAFFRRFLIVPFDVTIPEAEQDRNLHTKIIENELSGVFNWVLNGLNILLQRKRFTNCVASNNILEQYKTSTDSVKMFIDDFNYLKNDVSTKLLKDLYSEYKNYCFEDGLKPLGKTNFNLRLKNIGIKSERKDYGMVVYVANS